MRSRYRLMSLRISAAFACALRSTRSASSWPTGVPSMKPSPQVGLVLSDKNQRFPLSRTSHQAAAATKPLTLAVLPRCGNELSFAPISSTAQLDPWQFVLRTQLGIRTPARQVQPTQPGPVPLECDDSSAGQITAIATSTGTSLRVPDPCVTQRYTGQLS